MMCLLPHISEKLVKQDGSASYEMRGWMECVQQCLIDMSIDMGTDYYTEVAKGNVPGSAVRGLVFRNPNAGNPVGVLSDIWGGGSDLVYPTSAETWEIVSDNVNDTSAGAGAQSVIINYLDDNYEQQSIVVDLNGTSPVQLNADHFRPDGAAVISSGSNQTNFGEIVVRVAGGGDIRQVIKPGISASQDCHFTVPAGKTVYVLNVTPFYPKNEDGFISGRVIPFGTNTEITTGIFPFYQDTFAILFKALFPIQERTDVRFLASSSNVDVEVNMVFEILLVDNDA